MNTRTAATITALLIAAAPAASQTPEQVLADQTAEWVTSITGTQLQPRTVQSVDEFTITMPPGVEAIVIAPGDTTQIRNPAAKNLRALAVSRGSEPWSPHAAHVLLHERLHRTFPATELDRALEEGATEAITLDMWPAWVMRFTGRAPAPRITGRYTVWVDAIRSASSRATGQPWTGRASRLWRRELWASTPDTRRVMMRGTLNP